MTDTEFALWLCEHMDEVPEIAILTGKFEPCQPRMIKGRLKELFDARYPDPGKWTQVDSSVIGDPCDPGSPIQ